MHQPRLQFDGLIDLCKRDAFGCSAIIVTTGGRCPVKRTATQIVDQGELRRLQKIRCFVVSGAEELFLVVPLSAGKSSLGEHINFTAQQSTAHI